MTDTAAPSPVLLAFVDKADGVLRQVRRLLSGEWQPDAVGRELETLSSLADYAGNLELKDCEAATLDLLAYLSVFADDGLRPKPAQSNELSRLIDEAMAVVQALSGPRVSVSADVMLLSVGLADSAAVVTALELEGLHVHCCADGDALERELPGSATRAVIADASLLAAVAQILDSALPRTPTLAQAVLVALGGDEQVRLQALMAGADLHIADPLDPSLARLVAELTRNQDNEPYRVAIVDDDRSMTLLYETTLRAVGIDVASTNDPATAEALVAAFKPDLLLVDLYMPEMDGMSLTMRLRKRADALVLPILFLSGEHSDEARFGAIHAGGDDYLTKPIGPRKLIAVVRNRIKRVRALARRLVHRGEPSTGPLRRGAFLRHIETVLKVPERPVTALLVLQIHQASDLLQSLSLASAHELEQAVGNRIVGALQAGDCSSVLQEFCFGVLIARQQRAEVLNTAEELLKKISTQPFKLGGKDVPLALSIGVSVLRQDDDLDGCVNVGFAAARTASRLGSNRIEGLNAPSESNLSLERMQLISELMQGLKGRGLVIEFQPIMPLRGAQIGQYALETRLRAPRDPLNTIGRDEFVPIARQLKFQQEFDRRALSRALSALDDHRSSNRVENMMVPVDLRSIDRDQLSWLMGEVVRRPADSPSLTLGFDAELLLQLGSSARLIERLQASNVRVAALQRQGSQVALTQLVAMGIQTLRLSCALVEGLGEAAPALFAEWRQGRELIVDEVSDVQWVARLWTLGADYIQGDALATAAPRPDFDFSDINLDA